MGDAGVGSGEPLNAHLIGLSSGRGVVVDEVFMSTMGTSVAQSIAGMANAERAASREVDKAKAAAPRGKAARRKDEVELSGGAEAAEAVRALKDPTQEEAKEDRESKAGREPGRPGRAGPGRRLDVSG